MFKVSVPLNKISLHTYIVILALVMGICVRGWLLGSWVISRNAVDDGADEKI